MKTCQKLLNKHQHSALCKRFNCKREHVLFCIDLHLPVNFIINYVMAGSMKPVIRLRRRLFCHLSIFGDWHCELHSSIAGGCRDHPSRDSNDPTELSRTTRCFLSVPILAQVASHPCTGIDTYCFGYPYSRH